MLLKITVNKKITLLKITAIKKYLFIKAELLKKKFEIIYIYTKIRLPKKVSRKTNIR